MKKFRLFVAISILVCLNTQLLIAQNGEFSGIHMCCKNDQGKGMDHEVYPLFSVSSMPDESQRLISSILDVIEDRLM